MNLFPLRANELCSSLTIRKCSKNIENCPKISTYLNGIQPFWGVFKFIGYTNYMSAAITT